MYINHLSEEKDESVKLMILFWDSSVTFKDQ